MRSNKPAGLAAKAPSPADLRGIEIFRHLSEAELSRILPFMHVRSIRARASFILDRDFADRVLFALSGQYRLVAFSPKGAKVTLMTLHPGNAAGHVGAILGHTYGPAARLVADLSGVVLELKRTHFVAFVQEMPLLCQAVLRSAATHALDFASRVYELAVLDVRARLQAELLRLARHSAEVGGDVILTPAPTHEALGAKIAAAREAVTRHLLELEREDLIRIGRKSITIVDIERLRRLDEIAAGRNLTADGRDDD